MSNVNYDLIKLSEEAGEVIQETCKALRFGLDDINPKLKISNKGRIQEEILDFIFMCRKLNFETLISHEAYEKRLSRYNKWLEYAISKGKVNE